MTNFNDWLTILEDSEFEEKPVDIRTFVESPDYLDLDPLSDVQYTLVTAMTQIYKKETLIKLYGEVEGLRLWGMTVKEVIAQLGKGSGKDYCSGIAVAYIVYKLLCLKEPARYFGKARGDSIDILNIAINSQQARNVFFKGFKARITGSKWFEGRYNEKADAIEFEKNITCYSGHSERESWEGYNTFVVILDEIAGFAIENTTGHAQAKTAEAIYDMYSQSVASRFPATGKTILLSFPRYKGDFIQQRYNDVVAKVETTMLTHSFKLDNDLPDGEPGNEFTIEWEHDEIIAYKTPGVFALRRATWEVNPTWSLEDAKLKFYNNPVDSLARFACMPPDAIDAFFKNREKVEAAFSKFESPFDENWRFRAGFTPRDRQYFVHVDLGYKHDRAAVALAHVETYVRQQITSDIWEELPLVKIDAVRWWTPKPGQEIDFRDIRDYIKTLRNMGFDIKLVTFDRWQSIQIVNELNEIGIPAEKLSVAKSPHYDDLAVLIQDGRIKGYHIQLLIDELLQLRIINGNKVDHPRAGGKDLADAVCGAAYNCVALNIRDNGPATVEAKFLDGVRDVGQTNKIDKGVIKPPSDTRIPPDIKNFLARMETI